jgi:RNA polymerase sigma-54 factor
MKFDTQLVQRQEQRLALLPQMLASIEVLQMATVELLARIDAELEQNEVLEIVRPVELAAEAAAPDPAPADEPLDDWSPAAAGEDHKHELLHSVPAPELELGRFVREQVAWRELEPALREAVLLLAEHLDERGLLPFDLPQLAVMTGLGDALLHEALAELRSLEPCGLGQPGPVEAMLQQAAGDPDLEYIRRLLTEHLQDLAENKVAEVGRRMGLQVADVRRLLERIRGLDPRPGAMFARSVEPALRPEARAWVEAGEVRIALDDGSVPGLGVSAQYEAMLKSPGTERAVRDYLRGKVRSARELIDAIAHRQHTLGRVVAAVMLRQPEFLARGRAGIRPLRMAEVAQGLELHTSTVSRAIAGKSVQTDHGVLALRDFFDGGTGGAEAAGSGRLAVRTQVGELVAAEDKRTPLSDDELVTALAAKGITVARRTVTKYRRELGIPSSFLRRREST